MAIVSETIDLCVTQYHRSLYLKENETSRTHSGFFLPTSDCVIVDDLRMAELEFNSSLETNLVAF